MDQQTRRTGILAAGIVAGVALTVFVAVVVSNSGGSVSDGVTAPPRSADDWSHKELIDHLKSRGAKFVAVPSKHGLRMYLFPPQTRNPEHLASVLDAGAPPGNLVYATVDKLGSSQEAKDVAGVSGNNAFSWGRFVFVGHSDVTSGARRALN